MTQRPRVQRGLALWLASTSTPLFVLDPHRKILFFNQGCERLTGWQAGDVIGQVCDYVSEPDAEQLEALTGALCPPQAAIDGDYVLHPAFVVHRSGAQSARQILFVPLVSEAGTPAQILGAILPLPQTSLAVTPASVQELHVVLSSLRSDLRRRFGVSTLVGQSAPFRRMLRQLQLGRTSLVNVNLQGESGTGKGQLARLIHYDSPLRLKSFLPLDCRSLPARELKQTLQRALEQNGESDAAPRLLPGTIYLREADQLPRDVQQILVDYCARVDSCASDEGSLSRAVRLVSSSTRALSAAVETEELSEECFYLLTELSIDVPSLRDVMEDLPLIAQQLLEDLNRDQESQIEGFSQDVWQQFRRYRWPGNHQELQNVIREARARCTRSLIAEADLPFRFRTGRDAQTVGPPRPVVLRRLADTLEDVEREQIVQALELAHQNKSKAAELLGLTRPRLYRRMESLGLVVHDLPDAEPEAGQDESQP